MTEPAIRSESRRGLERDYLAHPAPWHPPYESVFPAYGGRSILNLHGSLLRAFGLGGAPSPLDAELVGDIFERAERVVVVLIDALGYRTLEALRASEPFPLLDELIDAGVFVPLTSVFPSSTNVILRTLSTGLTPAAHGVPGANIVLDDGLVANMIRFRATPAGAPRSAPLAELGIDTERFRLPTLFDRLAGAGIDNTVIYPYRIIDSPLSHLNHDGASHHLPFLTPADMALRLRDALDRLGDAPGLIYAYWDAIDTLQHLHGAGGDLGADVVAGELITVLNALERTLAALPRQVRRGTLLVLLADHGHTTVTPEETFLLSDHPDLRALLAGEPAGNTRAAYLRAGTGGLDELRAALAGTLPVGFTVLETGDLIRSGLLGPEGAAYESLLTARMGDLAVFPGPHQQFLSEPTSLPVLGRHSGIDPEEMLIPLVAADLGLL